MSLKQSSSVLYLVALFSILSVTLPVCAQVVPSASKEQFSVTAGGMGSVFQPDYSWSTGIGRDSRSLYGAGAYADAAFNRWLQIEVEGRWLRFNGATQFDTEDNYQAGFRFPIKRYGRFTPYGKALVGVANANFFSGNAFMVTVGGGVDYRLNKNFSLRAGDFEYQIWHTTPTIEPLGYSVGLGYKFF